MDRKSTLLECLDERISSPGERTATTTSPPTTTAGWGKNSLWEKAKPQQWECCCTWREQVKLAAADDPGETEEDYINANFIPGELIVQMQKASKATNHNVDQGSIQRESS